MNIADQLIQLLGNLSQKERRLFLQFAKHDKTVLEKLFLKLSRIEFAANTGNILLWKKMTEQEEKDLDGFIREVKDQEKIVRIKKELGIN